MVTFADIEAAKTPAGGWSKQQLAEWGVPWPPPKGWKHNLIAAQVRNREAAILQVRDDALKALPVLATMCRKIGLVQGELIALEMLERAKATL